MCSTGVMSRPGVPPALKPHPLQLSMWSQNDAVCALAHELRKASDHAASPMTAFAQRISEKLQSASRRHQHCPGCRAYRLRNRFPHSSQLVRFDAGQW